MTLPEACEDALRTLVRCVESGDQAAIDRAMDQAHETLSFIEDERRYYQECAEAAFGPRLARKR